MRSLVFGTLIAAIAAPAFACEDPSKQRAIYERVIAQERNLVADVPEALPQLNFTRADGTQGSLSDYAGTPTILTFWFPACPGCKIDLPELDTIAGKFKGRSDVNFVQISIGNQRPFEENISPAQMQQFLAGKGYNNLDAHIDPGGQLFAASCLVNTPTHLIINREGKVVELIFGALPWSDDSVTQMIESIIQNT